MKFLIALGCLSGLSANADTMIKTSGFFKESCTEGAKLTTAADGSQVCTLQGGGNIYAVQTFEAMSAACKKENKGIHPLSIALLQPSKCGTASIAVTCPSLLGAQKAVKTKSAEDEMDGQK